VFTSLYWGEIRLTAGITIRPDAFRRHTAAKERVD
jgi:hypothetical protein